MSRMIDADALREQLVWCKEQAGRFDTYWDDVIERLDSLPTIDAVPVVRCKDCIYRNDTEKGKALMWLPCEEVRKGDNWYCAEGERVSNDA